MFRRKIANKMKKMKETLDSIAEERKMFHLCETITPTEKKAESMDRRQTFPIITEPEVYGREEDKERIVQALTGTSSDVGHVSVYPIVGLGGLGKTTLAQHIFNDDRITKHFELKIWVCVSDYFSLKRMIKAILESALERASEDLGLDPLQKQLQRTLNRKRFLLVLDDVWSEDQEKWDRLKYSLAACGSKGASILVTTRLTKVASIMGTFDPHDLSFLSDEDCWSLFKQRAFGPNEEASVDLAAIGKDIAKKCKGIPLAAKALGGLLLFKREERDWLHVKDSEIWNLPQDENSILPALRLSYLNLPLKSKHCFSFCAIFPKDAVIEKDELVHLWMANGFISSTGEVMVEDVADEIINELCWASFFQDIEEDDLGNVKQFKMHDLLHDLAQSIMGDACTNIKGKNPKRLRHCGNPFTDPVSLHQAESLRTLQYGSLVGSSLEILRPFKSLRALDLRAKRDPVCSSITHFKHLRYLNLNRSTIEKLPESIGSLCNLQVLNLNGCNKLRQLPHHLKCLKALRHLCLLRCNSLSRMSPEMGQLTFLRTLNIYIVGMKKGFWLDELRQLCLKGQLHIKNLERVRSVADAKEANLIGKQLDELFLSWGRNSQSELQQNVEQILEALEPHSKLTSLGVGGYEGSCFPHWVGHPSFKNLCYLRLMDCRYILQLSQLRKLPYLKKLEIHNMTRVQYVDDVSLDGGVASGFPSLDYLLLSCMPNLERLSKEVGRDMFPCLSELDIVACPKLSFSSLPSVRKLKLANSLMDVDLGRVSMQVLPEDPYTARSGNQVQLDSIHNLSCLEFLCIYNDQQLTSFSEGMFRGLACLRELHIYWQNKLELLLIGLVHPVALEKLYIIECNSLESLTEQVLGGLHSLRTLIIEDCDNFKGLSAGFQCLTSLEDLIIGQCPQVVALAEDSQHIPMLQSIHLCGLEKLERLPDCWGSMTSLQSLHILFCSKLTSLPLSGGWLDSLKSLSIDGCPELQKRFERETGEDWHWIRHIPRVSLGDWISSDLSGLPFQTLSVNERGI